MDVDEKTAGPNRRRLAGAVLAAVGLVSGGLLALAQPAAADTAPAPGTPATVSADALPTVQIGNGVVWSQVTVGNTVYATGQFTTARQAGSPAGSNEVSRAGILAFDITTGNLTAFNHSLNGAGRIIVASPDGSRVYIGGDFTTVDGQSRPHIAAFDVATGALVPTFAPSVGGSVLGIAASNSDVFVGGGFSSAGGATRTNLAAFSATNGALRPWNPTADNGTVSAMVMAPDGSRVIVAGRFTTLDGQAHYGIGSIATASNTLMPWSPSFPIRDAGANSDLTSLTSDGTHVYGTGYVFGSGGNFEGTFSADPYTGNVYWMNSCHGDTYNAAPVGQVVYTVGHAHDCSDLGSWEDTSPRTWHRALANVTYPTGTLLHNNNSGYADFFGQPDASLLHWYPTLSTGTFTGASQAAWSATGNSNYIALGGEFPSVNGTAQQGLVRFAVRSLAPNKRGPIYTTTLIPSVTSRLGGTARLSWQSLWDQDNESLKYEVLRDNNSTPIYTVNNLANFSTLRYLSYLDSGLSPGSTHTYKIRVSDPLGNTLTSPSSSPVTIASGTISQYAKDVVNDGASTYWRLDESSGTAVFDAVGSGDATAGSGVTRGAAGAIAGDADTASMFNGTSTGSIGTNTTAPTPNTFTLEAWVKSTTTRGGKIIGYGSSSSGSSSSYDRHLYMDNSGRIFFGVYPGAVRTVNSSAAYNNGRWHHVAASLSGAGMVLYVDGQRVARDTTTTTAQNYKGYWRIGGDNLSSWPSRPASDFLAGSIDEAAVYPAALSLDQVQQHYRDGGGALPPAPSDSYGQAVYADGPDLYWRLDDASGPTAADSSPNHSVPGVYSGGVTYRTSSPVTGASGTGVTLNGSNGAAASSVSFTNPTAFTEELWFNTTTQLGGKLIGFGSSQTGLSTNYDRHVYMLNTGQLEFGVYTGQANTVISPNRYNDGVWHYLVATQGASGMALYVDGQPVGTNPQTQAQNYTGYWRVGGDNTWGGATSKYFAGSLDEVAVYSNALSAAQVLAHYRASSAAANILPTAAFTSSCTSRACAFDGSASSDPDGSIAGYAWNFGDGSSGTGATANHTYATDGTYSVTLTVTDNKGGTGTVVHSATVANQHPTAAFSWSCTGLACSFDGSGSSDPDGSIASYAWDFGDDASGSGGAPSHTFAAGGDYQVSLTVTDNVGDSGGVAHTVTVAPLANQLPTAAFTSSCSGLACSFDGSASSDPDGSIAGYAWDFGDGSTGSGIAPSHTYAADGTYSVTLTVTDNKGGTGTVTRTVTVTAIVTLASDDFGRTLSSGWGSADLGGAWTTGSSTSFSVSGGVGQVTMRTAGTGSSIYLNGVSTSDTDVQCSMSLGQAVTGGGVYTSVIGRHLAGGDYRLKVHFVVGGAVRISLVSTNSSGTETAITAETAVSGLTYATGDVLLVRFQATGLNGTSVRGKVWKAGSSEPSSWQASALDSTSALQGAGGVGLLNYLSGSATTVPVVASFDSFRVYRASTLP